MTEQGAGDEPKAAAEAEVDYAEVDYLEGRGPESGEPGTRSRRWGPIALLAAGGVGIAAAAAWGVTQFLDSATAPAAGVPDDVFGYLAVNLDPGAQQQVEAYRFLKKFPAFEDNLRLSGDEDLRRTIFDRLVDDGDCAGLDFTEDVQPWLGTSVAVAGRTEDDGPQPYVLVGISDRAAAEAGYKRLVEVCDSVGDDTGGGGSGADAPGVSFSEDFMVLAEDRAHATRFLADAAEGSLADDPDYQKQVSAAGGEGFLTGYLAASAADAIADELPAVPRSGLPGMGSELGGLSRVLDDFGGSAMSLRFNDAALELRVHTTAGVEVDTSGGSSGIADLPEGTAVAYGVPVNDTFVSDLLDSLGESLGEQVLDSMLGPFQVQTGLDPRTDLQPMLGDGFALALDGSVDVGALMAGGPEAFTELPVGLRVNGDPATVAPGWEKLLAALPMAPGTLQVVSGDGAVGVGPDKAYAGTLAADGGLGDQEAFASALPDLDDQGMGMYVDFDGAWWERALDAVPGTEREELRDNLEPLSAMGATGSVSDDEQDFVLRVVTD